MKNNNNNNNIVELSSGEWIRVGKANVTPFWIHCESGEITDGVDVFDTNIQDIDGLDYLCDMTDADITRLTYFFPKTTAKWRMIQIEYIAEGIAWRVEDVEDSNSKEILRMVKEIIALTSTR